ncbi:MAG TPA: transposase [Streptosporangiaceae bacterium]|nr:transposase [Streptosporangiaceae bacterium]
MIFGFLPQIPEVKAVAVAFSMAWLAAGAGPDAEGDRVQARDRLADFREELYRCFAARADELFELADSVLCAGGPVRALAGLSLVPEHRRGHGALHDAVNRGRIEVAGLRWSLAALALPRWPDGRIRLGVDVSNWLRPDAATSPERMFCHVYGRGRGTRR